jgi:hypothetical protein
VKPPGVADLWYVDSFDAELAPPNQGEDQTASAAEAPEERAEGGMVEVRRALPLWARFMADLGSDIALLSPDEPTTAVVSLPTREFAAAFAAAAVVIRYDVLEPAAPDDLEEHLGDLRELELGTRVQFREPNGKVSQGFWRGLESDDEGQERFCIEVRKQLTRKLPVSAALGVTPTGEPVDTNGRLQRDRVVEPPHLVRGLRGQSAAMALVTTSRCEVVIVGVATDLENDMCEQGFFTSGNEEDLQHGYLQDLVRVKQFRDAHRYYRSQVVSPSAADSDENQALKPRVVIYDGGRMFLQCSHLWPGSHRIVVLDRSAASAEDAALEINLDYADRRADSELGDDLKVPDGIELITYEHMT